MDDMKKITPGGDSDPVGENVARLGRAFPEVVVDGQVDFTRLGELVGNASVADGERFGLAWSGKRAAGQIALKPSTATLRPTAAESEGWGTTQNLILEGDNLEVLRLLQKSYAGQVKAIYVDPPYNTGNDFVYKDDFSDGVGNYLRVTGQLADDGTKLTANLETSGRFHTDWLNMMYPRLKLARELLREDGVLFTSIDGNEVAHLRQMLDEVFGAENFVSTIVWVSNLKGRQIAGAGPVGTHEYIHCVARNRSTLGPFRGSKAEFQGLMPTVYKGSDYAVKEDAKGSYVTKNELYNTNSAFNEQTAPTMIFRIHYNPETREVLVTDLDDETVSPGFLTAMPHANARPGLNWHAWRWSRAKILAEHEDLEFACAGDELRIWTKVRDVDGMTMKDVVLGPSTVTGQADLRALDMDRAFDTPKPEALIRTLVSVTTDTDDIVLDFFAGSGTTGHAVMAQNAADGGSRRFILVQLPEPLDPDDKNQKVAAEFCAEIGKPLNIAEVTKERLRRAAAKVREDNPDFDGDTGFRVFKLDSSNISEWDPDVEDLEGTIDAYVERIKSDRSDDDILFEVLLKLGLDLSEDIETQQFAGKDVHCIGAGVLFVCLDRLITSSEVEELAQGVIAWRADLDPAGEATVVFRDDAFGDDVAKTNMIETLAQHGFSRQNIRSV